MPLICPCGSLHLILSPSHSYSLPSRIGQAAYWVLVLASLHLGLHWPMVESEARRFLGAGGRTGRTAWRAAAAYRDREIATVAALASLSGVTAQLRSHCAVALNVGVTEAQMHEIGATLKATVGKDEAERASAALMEAIAQRTH